MINFQGAYFCGETKSVETRIKRKLDADFDHQCHLCIFRDAVASNLNEIREEQKAENFEETI